MSVTGSGSVATRNAAQYVSCVLCVRKPRTPWRQATGDGNIYVSGAGTQGATPPGTQKKGERTMAQETEQQARRQWRDTYESRVTTPEKAVAAIQSGDVVNIPIFPPRTILPAIHARRDELRGVRLRMNAPLSNPGWFDATAKDAFDIEFEIFIGDFARFAHDQKRGPYLPNLFSTAFKAHDEGHAGVAHANVGVAVCSPPNEAGYVHFGPHHWTKRSLMRRADIAIAEVDSSLLKVHGDVYLHVSEIEHFVEYEPTDVGPEAVEKVLADMDPAIRDEMRNLIAQTSLETRRLVWPFLGHLAPASMHKLLGLEEPPDEFKKIAAHLAEIIEDGDCIQLGVGDPSSKMVQLGVFDNKRDLGMHTELIVPGTAGLVERGIVNGARKNQFPGQVVAAAWTGGNDEDFAIINDNPTFQLFDPDYILDVRRIAANDRQVSINNALSIDLIGQINSESVLGPRMINGTGGQPETHIGAFLSKGGKAITLLPSTALGGKVSRIVPLHPEGSIITIPRFYTDIIITEHGVARLQGKNHWERANALIGIAHPDHRPDLRKAADELFV